MAEADLASYQLQLQQVDAALLADPESGELLKLKEDLTQVIDLTKELIAAQEPAAHEPHEDQQYEHQEEEVPDLPQPIPSSSGSSQASAGSSSSSSYHNPAAEAQQQPVKHWQVGEQCRALWGQDGQYYEATIDEISTGGSEVVVTFHFNKVKASTTLSSLQLSKMGYTGSATSLNKKEQLAKQREYLKKKKAKKAERFKQMDQAREDDKAKWQNFSSKAFGKKGFVKKSIFKTPENASGRVGVGTCGVGGQSMTNYTVASKYRRGN